MRGIRPLALLLTGLCAGAFSAQAFVRTMSSSGRPLAWPNPSVSQQANPTNASGLSTAQTSALLTPALSAWGVSGSRVSLAYTQSTGVPLSGANDGVNSIYFASAAGQSMDWGVVALTQVLYYVSSGMIAETDMSFNDNQYRFTANEGDTGTSIGGRTAIYLRDVATHEAGHVIGLDHSLVNQSSLAYTAFSGQYFLSNDDSAASRTVYPTGSGGSLSGTVSGTEGGIFGAHVVAINVESGNVEAGALAGTDGSFRIGDLPAGKYTVMVEPFGTDISSVSSYYQNVDHRFCGYSYFRRRFYSACGTTGQASVLDVGGGGVNLGTVAPSCSQMGNPGGAPASIASAHELPAAGGAAFGTMRPGDTHYYEVKNVSGDLQARALAYSLYSPVDLKVEILTGAGGAVAGATTTENVKNPGPGNVVNYDSLATATGLSTGDYVLKISSGGSRIPASKYSSGFELLDGDGHYLITLTVNGVIAASGATDMGACVSVHNTPQSATYREYSPEAKTRQQSNGCGSIQGGPGRGPFSGGMMQVLLTAAAIQLLLLARRWSRRGSLVRVRR